MKGFVEQVEREREGVTDGDRGNSTGEVEVIETGRGDSELGWVDGVKQEDAGCRDKMKCIFKGTIS